jgi:hypothetical protein
VTAELAVPSAASSANAANADRVADDLPASYLHLMLSRAAFASILVSPRKLPRPNAAAKATEAPTEPRDAATMIPKDEKPEADSGDATKV